MRLLKLKLLNWLLNVGLNHTLMPYERTRAKIFNYCNVTGIIISLMRLAHLAFISKNQYPWQVLLVNTLPIIICTILAICMSYNLYKKAILISFIFFPPTLVLITFFTSNEGVEMYLLLYLLFTFFFLHRLTQIAAFFCWILACYTVVHFSDNPLFNNWHVYTFKPDVVLALINYLSSLVFIFISMYFIKFEVWKCEKSIRKQKQQLKNLNNVKDKVFSVIAHDLRSPIASIILFLRSAEQQDFTPEELKNFFPQLREAMEETSDLLSNLLAWARNQIDQTKLQGTEISMAKLTQQTINFLNRNAKEKNIDLINEVNENSLAFADENSIQIVMRNLLANAIKFTRPGGFVKIRTTATNQLINIIVEDNGVGIPKDKQGMLFGHNYYTSLGTNKEKGTGLGLLICKEIIQKNGGTLFFSSEQESGSIFTFSLPAKA
jgi:two-component system, sensor histidine kinase and response regulator